MDECEGELRDENVESEYKRGYQSLLEFFFRKPYEHGEVDELCVMVAPGESEGAPEELMLQLINN